MNRVRSRPAFAYLFGALALLLASCNESVSRSGTRSLQILSGSENESLQPLLDEFNSTHGAQVKLVSRGSVEIMRFLQDDSTGYDAVWPANSIWISLGDRSNRVKFLQPVAITPVVLGVRDSLARSLGWVGRELKTAQIAQAVRTGKLRFAMTSATQSNSGAAAFLGFLQAFKGGDDPLQVADLENKQLREQVREILKGVNRTSGSSGWLKDLFLASQYDAMVNYESVLLETNRALVATGRKPLRILYPEDGLSLSDSPLGFLASGDSAKQNLFLEFQAWMRSAPVQAKLSASGRRPGVAGAVFSPDPAVWDTSWGVQPGRILSPFPFPSSEVIRQALDLYQTELRKPSHTVFCLDFSGSMGGDRIQELRRAMRILLTPTEARRNLLQPASEDTLDFLAFSNRILWKGRAVGRDTAALLAIADSLDRLEPTGGTAIHSAAQQALHLFGAGGAQTHVQAVVLLTDGMSNEGLGAPEFQSFYQEFHRDIPVFSIRFGEASQSQLDDIAATTSSRVFDGTKDLARSFRQVRGYN
ncbi:MAG: VWA domain-containing protein [Fibrobacteres bacterium]|nr:VWA domain-containing protein [Fibrobacterota bacterium]